MVFAIFFQFIFLNQSSDLYGVRFVHHLFSPPHYKYQLPTTGYSSCRMQYYLLATYEKLDEEGLRLSDDIKTIKYIVFLLIVGLLKLGRQETKTTKKYCFLFDDFLYCCCWTNKVPSPFRRVYNSGGKVDVIDKAIHIYKKY